MLECSICSATSSGNTDFCCPACARASLYPLRIGHAKTLLSKETLGRQIQIVIGGSYNEREGLAIASAGSVIVQEGSKQFQHELNLVETIESRERIDRIVQQSKSLKAQIEEYKNTIAAKKVTVASRQSEIRSAGVTLSTVRTNATVPLKKTIRKINHRHDALYGHLVSARVYLCAEAAALLGLRERKGVSADGKAVENYVLGGAPLVDLRDLNNYTPAEITASLNNVVHLLSLVCYYLGIRLPAELAIPGETRPSPTIYQPFSSYLFYAHRKQFLVPLSEVGIYGLQHLQNYGGSVPTGRPLTFDRKLLLLGKEDPTQYSLCIEGLSLMAWDVAWLCRTQGISIASENWEDVCALGRNLWLLLVYAPRMIQSAQPAPRVTLIRESKETASLEQPSKHRIKLQEDIAKGVGGDSGVESQPMLGELSHGTTYGFLRGAWQTSLLNPSGSNIEPWKFAAPVRINDRLKSLIHAELSGLEWEMLDEADFGSGDGSLDGQVTSPNGRRGKDTVSGLIINSEVEGGSRASGSSGPSYEDQKTRGTSGWTKLKSRGTL